MKKFIAVLIIVAFIPTLNAFAISKNEPFKKVSAGLKNVAYGTIEIPDNINETDSKGKKAFADCTEDTTDGVGRGIARIVGGIWEIATFWYPEE